MVEYDPYAYAVQEDPYPVYARLREEAPAYWSERLRFWALSRHADVLRGFRDVEVYSSAYGVSVDDDAFHENAHRTMSFLALDPPRHTRMRGLVSRAFTPRRVSELEPRIREIAVGHLEAVADQGQCDLIADFAGKFPMDVISELLGVPTEDRAELRTWADEMVHREDGQVGMPEAAVAAGLHSIQYFQRMLAERRVQSRDDLLGALLVAEIDGDRLSDDEIVGFLVLMIVAGNETTTKLIGNALYWMGRHPDQRARVEADPALIPNWVEETLRYDNSTQALARRAARDVPLHGQTIREGDKVVLLVGSANRDPRVFEDPDRFDLERDTRRGLHFGQGTHFCLGASLARLEGRVALEEIQRRLPAWQVREEGAARVHSVNVRGFARLPIAFAPGRAAA